MRFEPIFPLWVMAVIFIPFTIYLLWKEWTLKRRFKNLRCLAVLMLNVSIAAILVHPRYPGKSSPIILLTPEYSETKLDSILRANPELTVMHTENSRPYKNSKELAYNKINDLGQDIRFVVGQGLPTYALDLFRIRHIEFIASPLPLGIIKLGIPTATVSRKNFIEGTANTGTDSSVMLLHGPGGKEDSLLLPNKGFNSFKLSFVPRQAGNFTYEISITTGTTVKRETIPIYVDEARSLNILFIHHYPTFEIQHLKNFLSKKNHGVVVRYQLSKSNFRSEYLNHDPVQVDRLTADILDKFDLVITDGAALEELSSVESAVLKKSVQSGLGLLNVSPSSQNNRSNILALPKTVLVKTDTTVIRIGPKLIRTPANAMRLIADPSVTALHKNRSGILAGYIFEGAGKIACQFLQETYRLTLSGDSSAYSELWSPLIEEVAKRRADKSSLHVVTPTPHYTNEPMDVQVISSLETPRLLDDRVPLPLSEDVLLDGVWQGRTWGGFEGWHILETNDGASLPYYVSNKNDLRSLSIANQIEENKISNITFSQTPEQMTTWKQVPPLIFYLFFLISAGFLWLAPKL